MKSNLIKIKKADSKFLSIWWFAVIVVVSVGIVIGVEIFFSAKIDVRPLESEILADRVISCLNDFGNLKFSLPLDAKTFFQSCYLNETVVSKSGNYFLKIEFINAKNLKTLQSFVQGNAAFEKDCQISSGKIKAKSFARCSYKDFSLNSNGEIINIALIAGSNQEYRIK